jgi:hypothetical protein
VISQRPLPGETLRTDAATKAVSLKPDVVEPEHKVGPMRARAVLLVNRPALEHLAALVTPVKGQIAGPLLPGLPAHVQPDGDGAGAQLLVRLEVLVEERAERVEQRVGGLRGRRRRRGPRGGLVGI